MGFCNGTDRGGFVSEVHYSHEGEEDIKFDVSMTKQTPLIRLLNKFGVSQVTIDAATISVPTDTAIIDPDTDDPHDRVQEIMQNCGQYIPSNAPTLALSKWQCFELNEVSFSGESKVFSPVEFASPVIPDVHFTRGGSYFFAMTVFTTIGYGAFAPRTRDGRALIGPMALIGIAVTFFLGARLMQMARFLLHRFRAIRRNWHEERDQEYKEIPTNTAELLSFTAIIASSFFLLAGLTHEYEGWSFFDSSYFSWVTMTTIGFGDFTPWTTSGRIATIITSIVLISFFPTWGILLYSWLHALTEQCHNRRPHQDAAKVKVEIPAKLVQLCEEEGWVHLVDVFGQTIKLRAEWLTEVPETLKGCDCLALANDHKKGLEMQETATDSKPDEAGGKDVVV